MAKVEVAPTVTKSGDEEIHDHPAFAQVSVHHISGWRELYGSDFAHHNFVRIRISRSSLHRTLSRDWHMSHEAICEIDLSHAQYVAMIGAPNTMGQPCTLNYTSETGPLPTFPIRDSKDEYPKELKERIGKSVRALEALKAKIIAGVPGVSKKVLATLLDPINSTIMEINSNMPFVMKSFDEHMETKTEQAKTTVHAYMNNVLVRAGLEHLQGDIKMLENDSGDHHQKEDK